MAAEQLGNLGATTVGIGGSPAVGGYVAGSLVLNVVSTAGSPPFSTSAPFRVVIQDQVSGLVKALLKVTAINSSTQFAVAAESYNAVSIDNDAAQGDNVYQVQSGGALDAIRADAGRIVSGALPSDGRKGDQLNPTDDVVLWTHNGSSFQPFGPMFSLTAPSDTGYAWRNQNPSGSTDTVVVSPGNILQQKIGGDAGGNVTGRDKAIINATFTYTIAMMAQYIFVNFAQWGIYVTDGTKLIVFGYQAFSGAVRLLASKFDSVTAFNADYKDLTLQNLFGPLIWLQIQETVSNRVLRISVDGKNWMDFDSQTNTNFLTTTRYGFFLRNGISASSQISIVSISETHP